ncbi:helix-turn-helix domain-containing protein [Mucilaginibacter sp. SG564]|uniref:winged helix-turn-helix transcriptional regulator n=1 Tax=Mucilaginibacter sp. SG564 TaxID=2587022 RepID=UPI001556D956|nr:helix-turn-helix domain-containing protein [Mucilaginibacter sp. SG564]NOW94571.1 DNA-binding HxlR family transcriptional regulator [Mucilaginibacter sp. SG564]
MRKETSTNLENEQLILAGCGTSYTLDLIGGRWKPQILWRLLLQGSMRYSQLKNSMPNVSERILILQLRELEKDKLISRQVYAEVPPKVEYRLTDLGLSLKPVLCCLSTWGEANRPNRVENPAPEVVIEGVQV